MKAAMVFSGASAEAPRWATVMVLLLWSLVFKSVIVSIIQCNKPFV
ncbi:hypothetical protein MNB_SUP05-6-335 [hydrothermal vent metagenome]|uniref:Uncharacterized protein n=1 Tax=hydrothermal vent metagenome TaxID=652676 RepID=A0A1W1DLD7_9ZZZZ